jgi:hypothetical protein
LGWYEQRSPHTKAYDRYLMKQLIGSTMADVSLKENLGYDAVLGALERQVSSEVNWDEVQNLALSALMKLPTGKGINIIVQWSPLVKMMALSLFWRCSRTEKKDGKRVSDDNT